MLSKKRSRTGESGVFTDSAINANQTVFCFDEWIEDEEKGWFTINPLELFNLKPEERERFLRYSYDRDFDVMIGTMDWQNAKHISNFINHSCRPNLSYDTNNNIVARHEIKPGEELTIDYGNFIVNVDQEFRCGCGDHNCRHYIKKDDWKNMVTSLMYNFPTFMHAEISKMISGVGIECTPAAGMQI